MFDSAVNTIPERPFPHAMLREICEQPEALRRTLDAYCVGSALRADAFAASLSALDGAETLVIAASGSSRHAGLVGSTWLRELAGFPVMVEYASELICREQPFSSASSCLVLSQSGETADTLEVLRQATHAGVPVIAITNNPDSTMAKAARGSLPTNAGVERAIPATKSFTTQLLVLYLLALALAERRGRLPAQELSQRLAELDRLPEMLQHALPAWERQVRELAVTLRPMDTYLFLGRGPHVGLALEGALKLKESAYVQAEGYPAGELKHGPNALVGSSAVLIALATHDPASAESRLRYQKTMQLLSDLKRQQARVVTLANEGDREISALSEQVIPVPVASEPLATILEAPPLQYLAYFTSVLRGIDVDHPRNLAKAVLRE